MEKQSFWDRYARRYSHFVRADQEAYAQMLEWIRPAVRDRTVLELATGTGVIAHGIVHEAASIEATDASAGMITACAAVCRRRSCPNSRADASAIHIKSAFYRGGCQCIAALLRFGMAALRGCASSILGWQSPLGLSIMVVNHRAALLCGKGSAEEYGTYAHRRRRTENRAVRRGYAVI